MKTPKLSGFFGFTIIMGGQAVSLIGTAMSSFALTIWAFELTGSATALALVGFFFVTPLLIFSPIAGALVDRSNRKLMMAISDIAAGIGTLTMLVLSMSGELQIWHVYLATAIMGAGNTFQFPAYSAAITTMMSKEHYGRANGMWSLAETGSGILAPVLGAALYGFIGLTGILTIDLLALLAALAALLIVQIPAPQQTAEGAASRGSLWQESVFGFRYILKRPSLLGLQLIFLFGNFLTSISYVLMAPMILSRTGNNELALGTVSSIAAAGGVLGGVMMSTWGGTRRKVHGVLLGWALGGVFGDILLGLGRSLPVWAGSGLLGNIMHPWINGSNQAIWQAKVEPDVQGKVFSTRRLIAWLSMPAANLVAGPLADLVMEPAMRNPQTSLARAFSPLVGVGPGAGMALIIIFCGLGVVVIGLSGYLIPAIRSADTLLPDHDQPPPDEAQAPPLPAAGAETVTDSQSFPL